MRADELRKRENPAELSVYDTDLIFMKRRMERFLGRKSFQL